MSDLADFKDGVPERYVPDAMRGELLEAEHLLRYRWAAARAADRRVLDAGCGMAYGSALLAGGGAAEVVGVDIAEAVLESARPAMPENVRLETADLSDLPFADGSFDLVVCFEVIEHLEEPGPALDELARVLDPEGILLVSSPNRNVYPPVNPHHHHEFLPAELEEEIRSRLGHVALMRQHVYLTSAILTGEAFVAGDGHDLAGVEFQKLAAGDPDGETFTLAAGSRIALPELPQLALMTTDLELRRWYANFDDQQGHLEAHVRRVRELEQLAQDKDEIQDRLISAEQDVAVVPLLEERIEVLEDELDRMRGRVSEAEELRHRADQVVRDVVSSPSWRVTAPLRHVKEGLRRLRK